MKNILNTSFYCCLLIFITLSCDKNSGPAGCDKDFANQFGDNLGEIATLSAVYSSDPSLDNCKNLKDAYREFIDELNNWEDCAKALNVLEEWQKNLDDAKASLINIC